MVDTPIKIDLNEFKLHIHLNPDTGLTLHFDTPSRKFYLAVIALVINEMKKRNSITSIPLHHHLDELVLLNKTIGKEAGSSKEELLLNRIYRKWKDALPDLENAPLFKVIGRKKRYDDSVDKIYLFSEEAKDSWANLFEYMGSHKNVRLKFALNKLSLGLADTTIVYGNSLEPSADAWNAFITDLKQRLSNPSGDDAVNARDFAVEPAPMDNDPKQFAPGRQKRMIQSVTIGLIVILAGFLFWQYNKPVSSVEKASVDRMALPLPEKPSIAVLAFDNMSGDPNQEFFSDGISEEIITAISKSKSLFVVARNSTFKYKGKPINIKQIAEELGVRYVLEGSVRKSDDRVRITAQLIDAVTGNHLWAERYDRDLQDFFALQDEITLKIMQALQVNLTDGEQFLVTNKSVPNLTAKLKSMELKSLWQEGSIESRIRGGQMAQELIDKEPKFWAGYYWSAWYYWYLALSGKSPKESIGKALKLSQKALSLDENSFIDSLLSGIYLLLRQYDKAIALGEKSVALNPNGAENHFVLGVVLQFSGEHDEAIKHIKQAIRLDPYPEGKFFAALSRSYACKGQYGKALSEIKKAIRLSPKDRDNYLFLVVGYALADMQEEAEAAAKKILESDPDFSVERVSKTLPYKNSADLKLLVDALKKAGLPD
ncbi:MAG: hypothetical protein H8E61_06740 [Bacteroidetes bacterium]|nr:hypothetical protein [Bacteroidota bacterium]